LYSSWRYNSEILLVRQESREPLYSNDCIDNRVVIDVAFFEVDEEDAFFEIIGPLRFPPNKRNGMEDAY